MEDWDPLLYTLPLARFFEQAIGIDADRDMLAAASPAHNIRWLHLRAEELPAGLGHFRLVTFAQSFHWLDRPRVAATVREMLDDDGVCAHVHVTTHHGGEVPHPRPPHSSIAELVHRYPGPVRRAGRRHLPRGTPLFGDLLAAFETELRGLLHDVNPRGFSANGRTTSPSISGGRRVFRGE